MPMGRNNSNNPMANANGSSALQLDGMLRSGFKAIAATVACEGVDRHRLLVFVDPNSQSFAESQAIFITAFQFPDFKQGVRAGDQTVHGLILTFVVKSAFVFGTVDHGFQDAGAAFFGCHLNPQRFS